MTTPISTSIPYADGLSLRLRRDFRQLGDLLNDDGSRVTTAASFDANSEVTTALMDASGMIEAACLKGQRYSVADLQSLTGASKNLLVKLCMELAWWSLWDRRHSGKPILPTALWAFSVLDELEKGSRIFGLQEAADAGVQTHGIETPSEYRELNLMSGQTRMMGDRSQYRSPGRGGDFTNDPCCG